MPVRFPRAWYGAPPADCGGYGIDQNVRISCRWRLPTAPAVVAVPVRRQVGIECRHRRLVGRSGAEPDEAVRPHKDGAAIGHAGLGRIEVRARSIDNRDELAPARAEMVQARRLAEHDQMVARTAQPVAGREALSRRWTSGDCAGLADERASRVRDIEHQPPAHARRVLRRIPRAARSGAAAVAHRDKSRHQAMNLVRDLQHMAVGKPALGRVAVEQRGLCRATHDEGKFPGDVGGIHERRVQSFAAQRAGQMGGIAQQEAPPVAQALDHALVHLERGNPAEIAQPHLDAGPGSRAARPTRRLSEVALRISLVAIDKNQPAVIRQRREQYETRSAPQRGDRIPAAQEG